MRNQVILPIPPKFRFFAQPHAVPFPTPIVSLPTLYAL
jgi:hypothetical protein